jgi:group I intron endonuclease
MGIKMGIIYILENKINNKKYIGKTTKTFKERLAGHLYAKSLIGNSLRKYGLENFNKTEIFIFDELLNETEIEYIKKYNSIFPNGYNLTSGGEGVLNQPEEVKEKMRLAKLGKHLSEEHKKKIKDKRKLQIITEEHKRKIGENTTKCLTGKKQTEEHKKHMSEATKKWWAIRKAGK